MSQINITERPAPSSGPAPSNRPPVAAVPPSAYDQSAGARTVATSNLTWAVAVVLIIAAIAIALVYVVHNVHF